jgi:hypothetical protein
VPDLVTAGLFDENWHLTAAPPIESKNRP